MDGMSWYHQVILKILLSISGNNLFGSKIPGCSKKIGYPKIARNSKQDQVICLTPVYSNIQNIEL